MWKKNTLGNYEFVLNNFQKHFGDKELSSITSEDILDFMSKTSDGAKQNTKKLRFTLLSAFFNFVKNSLDPQFNNPCDNPQLRNFSGLEKLSHLRYWKRTLLMKSFSEHRVYETGWFSNLWLEAVCVLGRSWNSRLLILMTAKLSFIQEPKSGKEAEVVFLTQEVYWPGFFMENVPG
jgi:integrase/recombinase XerD